VCFSLILTATDKGVATADSFKVQTMLLGALGCILAWGIIDAGVYLLAHLNDRGRKILILHAMRPCARSSSCTADRSGRPAPNAGLGDAAGASGADAAKVAPVAQTA
jgi:hypothetical protein